MNEDAAANASMDAAPSAAAVLLTVAILFAIGVVLWIVTAIALRLVFGGAPRLAGGLAWIGQRTPVRRAGSALSRRAPRLSAFLQARIDPGKVSGLPLTLIVVAAGYLAFLIGGIVEELMEARELQAVDHAIIDLVVAPLRHPAVIQVFAWITTAGDTMTLIVAGLIATGFLLAHGPRAYILPIAVTIVGAQVTTWSGKYLFDRTRPEFLFEVTAASPSFPSGHATGSAAVYGFIAYVLARDLETTAARHAVGFWMAYGIALIAASRIILNVHWPSDVAVGLLVGGFWLLAGISVAELLRAGGRGTREHRSSNRGQV